MAELGLSTHEVLKRQSIYGKNEIPAQETFSAGGLFLSQFPTVINGILFIAVLLSLFLKNYIDCIFILTILIINAVFGFFQEYRAQKSIEKLRQYTAPSARVIRGGKEEKVLAAELVPDDIVILDEGGRVPADGVLTEVNHLEIDESVLTGESLSVMKPEKSEVYMGTLATKGNGVFAVKATGVNTKVGQIAHTLSSIPEGKTPLAQNMDSLGKMLSYLGLLIGLLIIPVGYFLHLPIVPLILVGASIGIAAIPEGLPAVVTIALALGTHRMAKWGAVVRKMPVIETLGAVQFILVDKTGTMTQNSMQVKKYWIKNKEDLPLLLESCLFGNTAALVEKSNGRDFEVVGDRTDGALLIWAREFENISIPEDGRIIDEYVFDSKKKTITTIWKRKGKNHVFVRGAPEAILERCELSAIEKQAAKEQFEAFAKEGLRVIGFGAKIEHHSKHLTRTHLERHLHFLGFLGLYDPPRKEVKDAVQKAQKAGINVVMVTGDNELTAITIAREIGIVEKQDDVVTGEQLRSFTDEELAEILTKVKIFARTRPEEKLRLVTLLQNQGFIVGVTGDGINDAMALEKANVGISMGRSGTDVARESSDIVLTDDNFSTLVKAVEEGRIIYKNILNATLYLISGNLAELSLVFFAVLLKLPFPFVPTQILWINLITDSLPALALAIGSKDASVMRAKPRDPKGSLLTPSRIVFVCLIGLTLGLGLLLLFAYILSVNSETFARITVFNLLIYFHLIIVMAIGRHSLAKGNIFLVMTVIFIFLLQIFVTNSSFFQSLFLLDGTM